MNFEFSEEQDLLREQARRFLRDQCPPSVVRKVLEGEDSFDRELWGNIAEMGWTATVIPEEYEGLGLSYLELSVIAEELGRAIAPVPFSSSAYLASEALLLAGSEEQKQAYLPGLAAGTMIGCLAVSEDPGEADADNFEATVSSGKLNGIKLPVADGDIADFAVVAAKAQCGIGASLYLVDLSDTTRESLKTIDPSRSHAKLIFNDAGAEPLGEDGKGRALLQQLYNRAAVLFAWEQVGGADTCLDQAKEYALGRFAFGRPIASFQAIKHKLANMYVKNTLARSNCYYGAWALSTDADELPVAAATARVSAIQAYYFASKENIQTHGGMGFTWEFDCHFAYRRSKLLATNIGSEAIWQEKLITAIEKQRAA
ncbi:MAG: acyl-CoA/acyl-ACP dehydrogenase [Gammaproteobacteria bacterium]|nr:acyl-CoA/acyl-ACP dehydrogenase [Gammaproteobacteria bacterium]